MKKRTKLSILPLVTALCVLSAVYAFRSLLDREQLQLLVQGWDLLGPVLFIGACALGFPLFIPPLVFVGLGSLAFGELPGVCYSLVGLVLGACLAFLLGRTILYDLVASYRQGRWQKIYTFADQGLLAVLSLRLAIVNFAPVSYAIGATTVPLPTYALGTLLGMLPRVVLLACVFEILEDAPTLQALLSHPSLPLLSLLPLTRVVGGVFIILLTRQMGEPVDTTLPAVG